MPDYDPRYLAGVLLFNATRFFEAHETWESLWLETSGDAKQFYKGLIQAAVCLLHLSNGNIRGAERLFHSARAYLENYGPYYLGLDIDDFCKQMAQTCQPYFAFQVPATQEPSGYPQIRLHPEPDSWPEPEQFLLSE